ncbi:MAG: hypothetical protein HXS40_08350 [Theionarchaea archaeon]|nr:hypothetical protein [Theionarchaea archaeon]
MGSVLVFDANVPICLDKIGFLEEALDHIGNLDGTIYINSLNFHEIHKYSIRKRIQESSCYKNFDHDELSYEQFKKQKLIPARIRPNKEDGAVLHTSVMVAANFLVSNDFGVIEIAQKLKEASRIKGMVPFTIVTLLKYLHLSKQITYRTFLKQSLRLFKNHEIENLFRGIREQNWSKSEMESRFKSYKDPIIENYPSLEGVEHG